jgi:site-specific DNA-methyltransferase (adenine-specific)
MAMSHLPKPFYETELGTLYHGDCLEILPHLEPVDLVLTDPPYGHNNNNNDMIANWEAIYGGKGKPKKVDPSEYRPIANDGAEANEIFRKCLHLFAELLKPGCCCCCCCSGGGPDPQFARWSLWLDEFIPFKQMVVWDKGPMGMGHHYRRSYETVLVAQKNGAACKWFDTTNKIENIIRPTHKFAPKIIPSAQDHPTVKPVGLMRFFCELHTQEGDIVLDPFFGSGTTGVACERIKRRWIGIEIEKKYCEIAAKRIEAERKQLKMF